KKGDTVEAIILKIDAENQRLSLGLKQLGPNVWDDFFQHHNVGDTVTGRVVRLADFGLFVEIAEGVEGLVHVSELADERVEHPRDRFAEGQEITAKILKLDTVERKVGLSIKAAGADADRQAYSNYRDNRSGGASIGDMVGEIPQAGRRKRREAEPEAEPETDED
ncbi:MAG TPA: S1 RNA-binding domain-containing protein, partial [Verrucomicrobiae bacterium]|nr:S1 RNA-binding domain-containing protein [Verrucomicrobiae bacterium]